MIKKGRQVGAPLFISIAFRVPSVDGEQSIAHQNGCRRKAVKMPRSLGSIEKIAFDDLPLLDLHGDRAALINYFQEHLLLIFLRHLA